MGAAAVWLFATALAGCSYRPIVSSCTIPCTSAAMCPDGFQCKAGLCAEGPSVCSTDGGPPASFRLIAPLSTSTVSTKRPTLRWLMPAGGSGVHVQICRDRPCTNEVTSFDATADRGAPAADLPKGVLFWRAAARGAAPGSEAWTPTWQFTVGARSAARDSARGSLFDPNGDGRADAIVGANGVLDSTGRVSVYYGGATGLDASATTPLLGPYGSFGYFASAVASVGDVDGDGYADALVGAYAVDGGTGRLYLYRGGATGLMTTPQEIVGPDGKFTQFGWAIAGAGDVNGDGYADVVVGAPDFASGVGQAYVFYGTAAGLSASRSLKLPAPETTLTSLAFGKAVAGGGDVDGDGYADVVIGAPGADLSAGKAYLYRGRAEGLDPNPAQKIPGPDGQGGGFGESLAAGVDVNGDGYADLLVGAGSSGSGAGRVHVFLGGPDVAGPNAWSAALGLTGPDGAAGRFGSTIAGAHDVNGDGYDDALVGAMFVAISGRAYVYFGGASGLDAGPAATFPAPASLGGQQAHFGETLAGLGDVDGNGAADLMVGAQFANANAGIAYVYMGKTSAPPATDPSAMLSGPDGTDGADGHFGSSIASLCRVRRRVVHGL